MGKLTERFAGLLKRTENNLIPEDHILNHERIGLYLNGINEIIKVYPHAEVSPNVIRTNEVIIKHEGKPVGFSVIGEFDKNDVLIKGTINMVRVIGGLNRRFYLSLSRDDRRSDTDIKTALMYLDLVKRLYTKFGEKDK